MYFCCLRRAFCGGGRRKIFFLKARSSPSLCLRFLGLNSLSPKLPRLRGGLLHRRSCVWVYRRAWSPTYCAFWAVLFTVAEALFPWFEFFIAKTAFGFIDRRSPKLRLGRSLHRRRKLRGLGLSSRFAGAFSRFIFTLSPKLRLGLSSRSPKLRSGAVFTAFLLLDGLPLSPETFLA